MATTTTNRPTRKRAASKTAPAAKAAEETAAVEETEEAPSPGRITFAFELGDETKTYQIITPPADSGCVGKLYVPKGVKRAKILLEG